MSSRRRLWHAACSPGGLYFIDLCLGFHVGFLGQHNMTKKLVMDARAIAWFYTRRGNFPVDLITAVAFFSQVHLRARPCYNPPCSMQCSKNRHLMAASALHVTLFLSSCVHSLGSSPISLRCRVVAFRC